MKRTESTSSAPVLKNSQPEEFDLVILGGGTGSDETFPILAPEIRERSIVPEFQPHFLGSFRDFTKPCCTSCVILAMASVLILIPGSTSSFPQL